MMILICYFHKENIFVKTDTLRGISKKNVETAIKILNSK